MSIQNMHISSVKVNRLFFSFRSYNYENCVLFVNKYLKSTFGEHKKLFHFICLVMWTVRVVCSRINYSIYFLAWKEISESNKNAMEFDSLLGTKIGVVNPSHTFSSKGLNLIQRIIHLDHNSKFKLKSLAS